MKKGNGFTLVEILIVFAILTILSLVGIESIVEFQKNALLGGTAAEFASSLREARTKSLAGELGVGEKPEDFTELPEYGVRVESDSYFLFREYQLKTDLSPKRSDLESFSVDVRLSLTPQPAEVVFSRITGVGTPFVIFVLERKDGGGKREIQAGDKGVILTNL